MTKVIRFLAPLTNHSRPGIGFRETRKTAARAHHRRRYVPPHRIDMASLLPQLMHDPRIGTRNMLAPASDLEG
jgi:hypothetical protein